MMIWCYPEPFNTETNIYFKINKPCNVSLKIFDMLGNDMVTIANEALDKGIHSYTFNAVNYPSGLYIIYLQAELNIITHKVLLIRN